MVRRDCSYCDCCDCDEDEDLEVQMSPEEKELWAGFLASREFRMWDEQSRAALTPWALLAVLSFIGIIVSGPVYNNMPVLGAFVLLFFISWGWGFGKATVVDLDRREDFFNQYKSRIQSLGQ